MPTRSKRPRSSDSRQSGSDRVEQSFDAAFHRFDVVVAYLRNRVSRARQCVPQTL